MQVGLVALLLGLTSCALGPDGHARRFHEAEYADLIVRHSTDETVFRLKPASMDGPFQQFFTRDQICADASQHPGTRELAVVLLDPFFSPMVQQEVINTWVASLRPLQFQRVVFLRNNGSDSINGLRVVADVAVAQFASVSGVPQPSEW